MIRSFQQSHHSLVALALAAVLGAAPLATPAQQPAGPSTGAPGKAAVGEPKGDRDVASLAATVTSKDGTKIAYEQSGHGPVAILISSALSDRTDARRLAGLLSGDLTVINYDRRGRGDSGDTSPYAVEREVEDIEALIDKSGGSAFVFGHSSGAVLALEAANRLGGKVRKAALFEPPFIVDTTHPPIPEDFVKRVSALVAADRRGDAVEYFMTQAVGVPPEMVAEMKRSPMWRGMERRAHTIAYDGTIMSGTQAGRPLPKDRWTRLAARTLILDGEMSDAFLHNAADALAAVLPGAGRRTLAGQDHSVVFTKPDALAPVLLEFFRSASGSAGESGRAGTPGDEGGRR